MPRWYSEHTVEQIRTCDQCSMQEALHKQRVSQLLDAVEASEDIRELRMLMSQFIMYTTKVI